MKHLFLSLGVLLIVTEYGFAQKDVADSEDHPLVSRYEGSTINRYSVKEYEVFTYPTGSELVDYSKLKDSKTTEGKITSIEYVTPTGVTATQVYRTYQTQLANAGFKIIFTCRAPDCGGMPMRFARNYLKARSSQLGNAMVGEKGSYLVASGTYENEPYVVSIVIGDDSRNNITRYNIDIVREELLDTDKVDVASVSEKLESEGRYAFYGINFDLNSAALKAESQEALQLMADYLSANSTTEVLIVGHTDNTGEFGQNMALSQKRAEAVIDALVNDYTIDRKRMTPVGVGMASPVASNSDEAGRGLNRRVELVIK